MNSQEKKDSEEIRKILEGKKADEKSLINIAGNRTHRERIKIRYEYKAMFGKDLMSDLNSKLYGNYSKTMLALFTDPVEFDVDSIYKAIKGAGTDEDTLIEIFASRPSWYLKKIKKKYNEKYERDLEEDVIGDASGPFKKLLVSLLQCKRSTNKNPDKEECKKLQKNYMKQEKKD